ncbi:hypothetical protein TNCV_1121441 [Trichonephila clavipes]|uniref:Uncharacterized protein n=1 Tax=Trichonephila clavipes TaxID=2585209 RepID=A0A8X6T0T2_TRICX|nr:hypothetical protein TNCV_1121441 [Trichonephila clavipes]
MKRGVTNGSCTALSETSCKHNVRGFLQELLSSQPSVYPTGSANASLALNRFPMNGSLSLACCAHKHFRDVRGHSVGRKRKSLTVCGGWKRKGVLQPKRCWPSPSNTILVSFFD